ncbi:MAG: hypothetical protein A2798_03455 [Candidatus Levybacteria bacterium RIFCSPHIGHO2_01_FULL_37_17]|nr:MAG: hypothetical protein A2798_03455 [Candidatus Levybacteria bacterium RIFCSPHIGHO2_01_FULL_37_17]OGH36910.1 MAG: hypothetical protein A2959_01445 [Candidatus Levybacteria bacterium RIFCSPLOWO2_01_FULL_38_23]
MKIEQFKKRILIFGIIALFLIALPVTIYLVRERQTIEQQAEDVKKVYLDPNTVSVEPDSKAEFSILINPQGTNVKNIKLVIDYDESKLAATVSDFQKDSSFLFDTKTLDVSGGKVFMEFGTDNAGSIFNAQKTIGKLAFRATGTAGTSATVVIESIEVKDADGIVVSGFTAGNGQVTIGQISCPGVGQAECSWDSVTGATKYHVKITEEGNTTPIFDRNDVTTTKITFESKAGKNYTCEVFAENVCGVGDKDSDTVNCSIPSSTPTLSPSPTKSPTPTPTSSPTPTPTVTTTPTPTTVITSTPTPTLPPDVTPTNTPTPTPVEFVATSTPIPTLPPTGGNAATIGAIVAGALIIIGGLLLLIL